MEMEDGLGPFAMLMMSKANFALVPNGVRIRWNGEEKGQKFEFIATRERGIGVFDLLSGARVRVHMRRPLHAIVNPNAESSLSVAQKKTYIVAFAPLGRAARRNMSDCSPS